MGPSTPSTVVETRSLPLDYMRRYGFKKVLLANDAASGLRAVIAIHSTTLGPAGGGVRFWPYVSEHDAVIDAMRLARGMTYKYAAAGIDLGGGKAVIIGDPAVEKTEALLRAFARFVDELAGEYYVAEDVGTTPADMEVIHRETDYLIALPSQLGGPGDVAPATARGSVEAIRACAKRVWGDADLRGRTVALQGLGAVGSRALSLLKELGAVVTVTDVDDAKVAAVVAEHGVDPVAPEEIYDLPVDIFAPYALGGVINDRTLPRLKVKAVAGAANNIFAEDAHGDELERRGIVYAVDFIANSGGTVYDQAMVDRVRRRQPAAFDPRRAEHELHRIFDRVSDVFEIAELEGIPCWRAAELLAERRIDAVAAIRPASRSGTG